MENDDDALTTQPEPTLREMIAENLKDAATEAEAPAPAEREAPPASEVQAPQAEAPKPGKTAGRPRDEKGRLLPGKPVLEQATAPTQTESPGPQAGSAGAVPAPSALAIQRPSTWKKEHWAAFDQLATQNPALAAYIQQREAEYAKGVST